MRRRSPGALDVLEQEDRALLELFGEVDRHRGRAAADRCAYEIVRHLAVRSSALAEVADGNGPGVAPASSLAAGAAARRAVGVAVDEVEREPAAGRHEYDGPLSAVMALVRDQIAWEREVAIPVIEQAMRDGRLYEFTQDMADRHARVRVGADEGPRWFERTPGLSWLLGRYGRRQGEPLGPRAA